MEVLFFNNAGRKPVSCWEEVSEESMLGGGRFSKAQIIDLLSCMDLSVEQIGMNIWKFGEKSVERFVETSDELLKDFAVKWSECDSWAGIDINTMDFAGHLLEIKHSYLSQVNPSEIWLLFE